MISKNKFIKYMEFEKRKMNERADLFKVIGVSLFLVIVALLVSCRTIQPVVGTHNEQSDSIRTEYRYDSVFVDRWHTIWTKGDTVYIHDSVDRWRTRHDSIYVYKYINTTDTIVQQVEIEKAGAAFWHGSGIAFWVLLGMLVLGIIIGLIIKFAK